MLRRVAREILCELRLRRQKQSGDEGRVLDGNSHKNRSETDGFILGGGAHPPTLLPSIHPPAKHTSMPTPGRIRPCERKRRNERREKNGVVGALQLKTPAYWAGWSTSSVGILCVLRMINFYQLREAIQEKQTYTKCLSQVFMGRGPPTLFQPAEHMS